MEEADGKTTNAEIEKNGLRLVPPAPFGSVRCWSPHQKAGAQPQVAAASARDEPADVSADDEEEEEAKPVADDDDQRTEAVEAPHATEDLPRQQPAAVSQQAFAPAAATEASAEDDAEAAEVAAMVAQMRQKVGSVTLPI